ncbi:hypothetical protein H4696_007210 [Amycolatopsis lexingtonensis]|uniref:SCP domain-containing protein n=1 Tax=Amycolatopsis lexingtonensis TaxID=218822 RepID=A0ABR9IAC7_9PSEU|nr:hypothetical protein [Amycolatopsis lexingtonensis]MBE1500110.1 hypothetical protein [Amycolatopsis lexingtonensis]
MAIPSDVDLGQSLRLIRALNALRVSRRYGPLPQVEAADVLAWQLVVEMQKRGNRPADPYGPVEVSTAKARAAGFKNRRLFGYRAYKAGTEVNMLPRMWARQIDVFGRDVLDSRVIYCGAAHQNRNYVLIFVAK